MKGCSCSRWVAAYLGETTSLSTSEKKSNNPDIALRRKDLFSSSHRSRSLRSRSHTQCSFARTSSPQILSICRLQLCFGSAILGAYAYIHPFSSLLSMLGILRDQWEACVAAWRFVHCLAIVEGGKTTDARGSSTAPARPQSAYGGSTFALFPCVFMVFELDKTVIARASVV